MPEFDIYLPIYHPAQKQIADHTARFKVLACGRRFGKTELATTELAIRMIKGQRVAYFAPSYKMTMESYRLLFYRLSPLIKTASRTEGRIELITGGIIDMWSLSTTSAETVRGRKYHFVVIDEAALIVNGMAVWDEVIRPLLMDYQGGALFCSTPKGRNHFFTLYQRGKDPLQDEWYSFNFPSTANPLMTQAELASAKKTTVDRAFQQEYLAIFLEDAGTVFRGVTEVSTLPSIVDPFPAYNLKVPIVGHIYAMGVDWGRTHDFTVVSVMDIKTRQQVYLDRFNTVSWQLQRGRLEEVYNIWRPEIAIIEANSIGEVNIEELQAAGVDVTPFYTTGQSKPFVIDSLSLAIEKSTIQLLNNEQQILELQSYEGLRTASGHWTYSAPEGGFDDTVMALALCYFGVEQAQVPMLRQAVVKGRG